LPTTLAQRFQIHADVIDAGTVAPFGDHRVVGQQREAEILTE
jgi:hypothetical protein